MSQICVNNSHADSADLADFLFAESSVARDSAAVVILLA